MRSRQPNVVMVTLDALRADRTSSSGYPRDTTPNIDRLLRNAYHPQACYALSPCTFGSFPSMMTSTRPLSYGGFDNGIDNRPPSITDSLGSRGYRTAHITTVHWANSFFGYDAEREDLLVDPATLTFSIGLIISRHISTWAEHSGDPAELFDRVNPLIRMFFENMLRYCDENSRNTQIFKNANNLFDNRHFSWPAAGRAVAALEASWKADPSAFINGVLANVQGGRSWLHELNWRRYRTLPDKVEAALGDKAFGLIGKASPKAAEWWTHRWKKYPDAETIVDRILQASEAAKDDARPFFIWGHMFDSHLPYAAGAGRGWAADASRWLAKAGHDPMSDPYAGFRSKPQTPEEWAAWNAIYDAAICFMDHHIGRLKRELEARGLGDTIIVLTNDHGEEMGEHGDVAHKFRLYEHNVRTHTVVHHPDLAETGVGGLCTLMDIAPTIAGLTSGEAPAGWEGRSFQSLAADPRREVVMETFFGSPCDVLNRPIYFAARSGDLKLIWSERIDSHDPLSKPGAQLFDLAADPSEQVNLATQRPDDVARLMRPIIERLTELKTAAAASPNTAAEAPQLLAAE